MLDKTPIFSVSAGAPARLARTVLAAFLLTFITARIIVFMIMSRKIPDLYLYVGGTHIHHLNYGIFLLAGVGAYLLLTRPHGRNLQVAALLYGVGMGLTFDEFGIWIHLGGGYWQRASYDAVTVIAALFALVAFVPSIKRFRPHHWLTAVLLAIGVALFFFLLINTFDYAAKTIRISIQKVESTAPK